MELTYTITELSFAPAGSFAHPHATVLVQPAQCALLVVPAIKLRLRLTAAESAAGLPAIAAAALAEAEALLPRPAAARHLQALLDEETALQQQREARDAAALLAAMDAARPPSGG